VAGAPPRPARRPAPPLAGGAPAALPAGLSSRAPRAGARSRCTRSREEPPCLVHQLVRSVIRLQSGDRVRARARGAQEAGESFSFPDTITSVSYQLRKAYQNLLWDYEQVYLWRAQGARAPPPSNPAAAARGETAEGAVRAGRPMQPASHITRPAALIHGGRCGGSAHWSTFGSAC